MEGGLNLNFLIFPVLSFFDEEKLIECSYFLVEVFDLGFEGLVEFAELVVEFDDFGVLVEFFLDLIVESGHEGAEETNGVVIGLQRDFKPDLRIGPNLRKQFRGLGRVLDLFSIQELHIILLHTADRDVVHLIHHQLSLDVGGNGPDQAAVVG